MKTLVPSARARLPVLTVMSAAGRDAWSRDEWKSVP